MPLFHNGQSLPPTRNALSTSAVSTTTSFPSSVDAVRARIHDVVRKVDDVMGTTQHFSHLTASNNVSFSGVISSPRVDALQLKSEDGERRHDTLEISSVAAGTTSARRKLTTLEKVEPSAPSDRQPLWEQRSASLARCSPTSLPLRAAISETTSRRRGSSTFARASGGAETPVPTIYAAALEYWRTTRPSAIASDKAGREERIVFPGVDSAFALSGARPPSDAPMTGAHNSLSAVPTALGPAQPLLFPKEEGSVAGLINLSQKAYPDMDVPTNSTVVAPQSSKNMSTVALPPMQWEDHEPVSASLFQSRQGALQTSHDATAKGSAAESNSSIPNENQSSTQLSPRALVDDSYFYTNAPAPLPPPSSVPTLSARLAALRSVDAVQHSSVLEQQKRRQVQFCDGKKEDGSESSAALGQHTARLADSSAHAHRCSEGHTSRCFSTGDISAYLREDCIDSPGLPHSSGVADTSASDPTSYRNMLVRTPSSKHSKSPTAEDRREERRSRQEETSFIVSIAQQVQTTREDLWRDARVEVQHEPPRRLPPPLPLPETNDSARYRPSFQLPEHRSGGSLDKLHYFPLSATKKGSAPVAATLSSSALRPMTAPPEAFSAGLSPSTFVVSTVDRGVAGSESLPLHEELVMRERLSVRRRQQRDDALVVQGRARESHGRYYEQMLEVRDHDVAAHLRGEVIQQTPVHVAAQKRVAQVRAAFPEQPDMVTSEELLTIRRHAQHLQRLREELGHDVRQRSPFQIRTAAATSTDVVSATSFPSSRIAPITNGGTRSRATEDGASIVEGTSTAALQQSPSSGEVPHFRPHPLGNTVAATASLRINKSDVAVDACSVDSIGRHNHGIQATPTPDFVVVKQGTTPVDVFVSHGPHKSSSSSQGSAPRVPADARRQRGYVPDEHDGLVTAGREAVYETGEGSVGDSQREGRMSSTQLPPPSSNTEVPSAGQSKSLSSFPVQLQRATSSASTFGGDGSGTVGMACDARLQPCGTDSPDAALVLTPPRRTLTVPAMEEAKRDVLSSSPSRSPMGQVAGSMTPERFASIQSTRLYVSSKRGAAWKEDSEVCETSSSSLFEAVPTPTSPVRPSRMALRQEGAARPLTGSRHDSLRNRSRASSHPTFSHSSLTPAKEGASRTIATGTSRTRSRTPHRETKRPGIPSGKGELLPADRRIVRYEVGQLTVYRAQALLVKKGVVVDVRLVKRRVSSLLRLSRDRKEFLFYLDRVEQVPQQQSSYPSPLPAKPASTSTSAPESLYSVGLAVRSPLTSHALETASRATQLPRFYPPFSPAAAISVASSDHLQNAMATIQPHNASSTGGAALGCGKGVAGVPSPNFGPSASQPHENQQRRQKQASVPATPSQSAVSAPLHSTLPLIPQNAMTLKSMHDVFPYAATRTRPIHVRELHHFPCAKSRVYAPFGVMGYERDRGLGGPGTWEDVSGVLCGPASFEVLRRYRCPLFADFGGQSWAPYRVYLIIPEFERIDVPRNAVLLVLDFRQRVDWVLFLMATRRGASGGCIDHMDAGECVPTQLVSGNGGGTGSPGLSYGRALWMLAAQRLHRARALGGTSTLHFDASWPSRCAYPHDNPVSGSGTRRDTQAVDLSYLGRGAVRAPKGVTAAGSRVAISPHGRRDTDRASGRGVHLLSGAGNPAPLCTRRSSPALHRDPWRDPDRGVALSVEESRSRSAQRGDLGHRSSRQRTHSAQSHASYEPPASGSMGTLTAQETSKQRFGFLRRVSQHLRFKRISKDE